MASNTISYAQGILDAHHYLLNNHPEVFVFGQGLWSPWYVGATMTDLDKVYGKDRIIDSPVSEVAVTGAALGASLCGYRPLVVHPRVDFMILAIDQIVTQAAKWSHMFGGQVHPTITFRGIINRGGEQGAQHSQALHSWFAHIPGLRVVMPATPKDARDLLIASVLSNDPVMFIDDRWLYEWEEDSGDLEILDLSKELPKVLTKGIDLTLVGCSYTTKLCLEAAEALKKQGISVEVIDMRIINPIDFTPIAESVKKTKHLCVVDGGWSNCGLAGEIIAGTLAQIHVSDLKKMPSRITIANAPAPTSKVLEDIYYIKTSIIIEEILEQLKNEKDN